MSWAGGTPSGECTSTRTIDRWTVVCGRTNRHQVHQALVLGEDDKVTVMNWDDRPFWQSPTTTRRIEAERAERRKLAGGHVVTHFLDGDGIPILAEGEL